jgi:hypothetical protein
MTVSQSSVTFFLAVLALLAHFSDTFRDYAIAIRDWATGTNFAMTAALVDLDGEDITAILSSRRSFAVGVDSAICSIYLPVNSLALMQAELAERNAVWEGTSLPAPKEMGWVGPILLGFELDEPAFLASYSVEMLTFKRAIVGLPGAKIIWSVERPPSFCSFGGVDKRNEVAASFLMPESESLRKLDAVELLQQAELDEGTDADKSRLSLIDQITELRAKDEK